MKSLQKSEKNEMCVAWSVLIMQHPQHCTYMKVSWMKITFRLLFPKSNLHFQSANFEILSLPFGFNYWSMCFLHSRVCEARVQDTLPTTNERSEVEKKKRLKTIAISHYIQFYCCTRGKRELRMKKKKQ